MPTPPPSQAAKPSTPGPPSGPGSTSTWTPSRARSRRPAVLAHALGEQSFALSDLGHHRDAVALLDEASAVPRIPPLMRSWLAAAPPRCSPTPATNTAHSSGSTRSKPVTRRRPRPDLAVSVACRTHLTRWRGKDSQILATRRGHRLPDPRARPARPQFCARRIRFARRPCAGIPPHRRTRSGPHARARRKANRNADRLRTQPPPRATPPRTHLKNWGHNSFR